MRKMMTISSECSDKPRKTRRGEMIVQVAKEMAADFDNTHFGDVWAYAIQQFVEYQNPHFLNFMEHFERAPVGIEEFIDSRDFIAATEIKLWPEVRKAIIEINQNWYKGERNGATFEALLMGATRTGKTEIAKITTLYHLYLLTCMKFPQLIYGLPKSTSIVFVIQAAKPHVTKKVVYMPMRKMVEHMPYFRRHVRMDRLIESEMYFPEKNIRIVPGGSDADTVLGEAVVGAVIDEINFMNIVQKSKRAEVSSGRVGIFDQAASIHSTISRRKRGTFQFQGQLIGVICTSSSTRYKGDFTDKRKEQVEEHNERGVYLFDKPQYEVQPLERYCGETFRLLVGNNVLSETRVLRDGEKPIEGALILDVPIEYEKEFLKNPNDALRDVCGISDSTISPFIRRRHKITECVMRGHEEGLKSFLVKDNVVLGFDDMPIVKKGHYCKDPSRPRFVHIDLAITGDRCAVAMVRFDGLHDITRGEGDLMVTEQLPTGSVEMCCTIEPDGQNEIIIAEVRAWVKQLKDIYGYPIKIVTYDGFQSVESRQQWKKQGMRTGLVTVDRTSGPYKLFRDALYDTRVKMYDQPILLDEIFNLEYDAVKDKVDHPPTGGKDAADAVCGAFTTMLNRRASWTSAAMDDKHLQEQERYDPGDRYDGDRA
jgi:hypothetical protein